MGGKEEAEVTEANVPAPQEPSEAQKQRDRMDALVKAVESRENALVTLLGQSGIGFDRFVEVFRRALIKGAEKWATNLLRADAGSVIQACIDACTAGLLPDGRQGAIVIYNVNVAERGQTARWVAKAQFIAMYEGLLKIAYASGNFRSIMAHLVYEGDDWDYELGITPRIQHRPKPRPPRAEGAPDYQIVGAYAVAHTTNGGIFVEVFEPEDIRKVMAASKAKSGPAKDWPEQMARKGPLRRLWKFIPRNERMEQVLDVDREALLDDDLGEIEQPKERRLRAGFSPAALSAPTDAAMDMPMDNAGDMEPVTRGDVRADMDRDLGGDDLPDGLAAAPIPGSEPPTARPEVAAFDSSLEKAKGWLNVKQALRSFRATDYGQEPRALEVALNRVWDRMQELRGEGDRTDAVSDPVLFEAWLVGADPNPDDVEVNWSIVQSDPAYENLPWADRDRISGRVADVLGAADA